MHALFAIAEDYHELISINALTSGLDTGNLNLANLNLKPWRLSHAEDSATLEDWV